MSLNTGTSPHPITPREDTCIATITRILKILTYVPAIAKEVWNIMADFQKELQMISDKEG
ncbi:MAG: hypothetical protein RBG13Loki_2114 [Promethearchaeota archaeon CR_4]|nr:MAG: hypothetical protein RBG13Loki_2114 [Candidatus Lokiarchaeota archaeon CR_4]